MYLPSPFHKSAAYFPEDRNMCKEHLQHSSKQLCQAAGGETQK
jgi:hypothetical protein